MSLPKGRGLSRLAVFGIPLLALVAVAIVMTMGRFSHRADADVPHAGLDYAIAIDTDGNGTDDCTTRAAGPTTCPAMAVGTNFLVKYYLDSTGGVTYTGFDVFSPYTGVSPQTATGGPTVMIGFWPDCGFPASFYTPGVYSRIGCAQGLGATGPSSYTGEVATIGFTCTPEGTGDISIKHGDSDTSLTDEAGVAHAEGAGTMETLHVVCHTAGAATDTPVGPTNTPAPTNTAGPSPTATNTSPPTATRTPTNTPPPTATRTATPPSLRGDANGDHEVTSQDAQITLQFEAHLRTSLPNMTGADSSLDGHIDSIDALFDLWIVAEMVS